MCMYKTDYQQELTEEHRELYSIFCNNLYGKRIWKRIDIYVTESLFWTPEANVRLLTNYTPI